MKTIEPVNKIRINGKILKKYILIHQYDQKMILDDDSILKLSDVNISEIFDELNSSWNVVKKWRRYLSKKYISRSSSMKGKNTWSKGRVHPNKGLTNEEFFGKEKAKEISKKLSEIGFIIQKKSK